MLTFYLIFKIIFKIIFYLKFLKNHLILIFGEFTSIYNYFNKIYFIIIIIVLNFWKKFAKNNNLQLLLCIIFQLNLFLYIKTFDYDIIYEIKSIDTKLIDYPNFIDNLIVDNTLDYGQAYVLIDNFNNGLPEMTNFHTNFSNKNNFTIINLMIWRQNWWFLFCIVFVLGYSFFLNALHFFNQHNFMELTTSRFCKGFWGDIILSIIPITWCLLILSHSAVLLAKIDYFSSVTCLNIRIRGKQWYWVYRFDKQSINNLNNCVKVIGSDILVKFKDRDIFSEIDFTKKKKYEKYSFLKYVDFSRLNNSYNTGINVGKSYDFSWFNFVDNLNTTTCKDKLDIVSVFKVDFKKFFINNPKKFDINRFFNKKIALNTLSADHGLVKFSDQYSGDNYISISQKRDTFQNTYSNILSKNLKLRGEGDFFIDSDRLLHTINSKLSDSFWYNQYKIENNISGYDDRLMWVDRVILLPINTPIRIISNSYDVIHSWFVPGLAIKLDCIPGKSISTYLYISEPGIYIGSCAEICGRFHTNMPIRLLAVDYNNWFNWIQDIYKKN